MLSLFVERILKINLIINTRRVSLFGIFSQICFGGSSLNKFGALRVWHWGPRCPDLAVCRAAGVRGRLVVSRGRVDRYAVTLAGSLLPAGGTVGLEGRLLLGHGGSMRRSQGDEDGGHHPFRGSCRCHGGTKPFVDEHRTTFTTQPWNWNYLSRKDTESEATNFILISAVQFMALMLVSDLKGTDLNNLFPLTPCMSCSYIPETKLSLFFFFPLREDFTPVERGNYLQSKATPFSFSISPPSARSSADPSSSSGWMTIQPPSDHKKWTANLWQKCSKKKKSWHIHPLWKLGNRWNAHASTRTHTSSHPHWVVQWSCAVTAKGSKVCLFFFTTAES